jgi:hypothetical protein
VFFTTRSPLVPDDADDGYYDVYEWTAGGIGLVSPPGAGIGDVQYLDSTPDGSRAFLALHETVLGSDVDAGQLDVYASVLNGGLPAGTGVGAGDGSSLGEEGGLGPAVEMPDRPTPGSTTPKTDERTPGPGGRKLVIGAARLAFLQRRLAVRIGVPRAGRVSLSLRDTRTKRVLAKGGRRFSRKASGVVRLRLTKAGRARLEKGGRIRAVLDARLTARDGSVVGGRSSLTLKVRRNG